MSKVIDVAAGLIFRNGELLITQRRPGDHLGGLWEFPGGKVEADESFEHCLVRELREELGIQVRVGAQIEEITHSYPEKTVRLRFFRCELISGEPRPIHCHALTWVTAEAISEFEFPAADEQLLHKLQSDRSLWTQ